MLRRGSAGSALAARHAPSPPPAHLCSPHDCPGAAVECSGVGGAGGQNAVPARLGALVRLFAVIDGAGKAAQAAGLVSVGLHAKGGGQAGQGRGPSSQTQTATALLWHAGGYACSPRRPSCMLGGVFPWKGSLHPPHPLPILPSPGTSSNSPRQMYALFHAPRWKCPCSPVAGPVGHKWAHGKGRGRFNKATPSPPSGEPTRWRRQGSSPAGDARAVLR